MRTFSQLKIAIIEDDETSRELLASYLTTQNMSVYSAASLEEFKTLVVKRQFAFDIVLVDLGLPGESGMTIIEPLRSTPNTGIIILSSHADQETKIEALRLGADDYITKPFHLQELLARIHSLGARLSNTTSDERTELEILLSPRELSVLVSIASGETSKHIAKQMDVSHRTVETYRNRLISKLNVRSIAQLTQIAMRAGLV